MQTALLRLARVLEWVSRLVLIVASIGLIAMTLMVAWQIWGRYVNNSTPSWTEALSILVMSWFIFLGAAIGVRENFHLGFDVLVYVLPAGAAPVMRTLSDLAVLVFGLGMAWYGWQLTVRTWSDQIAGLGIARGVGYIPLFAGGVLVSLFVLERLARRFAGLPVGETADAANADAGNVAAHEV